jgi:membrane protease YdiL (CAAX protease family)
VQNYVLRHAKVLNLPFVSFQELLICMVKNPLFGQSGAGFQLILFLSLVLLGLILSMLAGVLLSMAFYGLGFDELGNLMNMGSETALKAGRLIQVVSQTGIFIIPPLIFALLVHPSLSQKLGFDRNARIAQYAAFVLLMFACLPLIHELAEINKNIQLPQSFAGMEQWMQQKETEAKELTDFFLGVTSIRGLMFNLFMIALLPSIGEELLFRSVLQPLLGRIFRNIHVGIILAALLFSLMHLQFYGLIPRFVLGLFLGYAYLWTGSIWVPMVMHFVNNASAIIVFYLAHNGYINVNMDEFGSGGGAGMLAISLVLCTGLLVFAYRASRHNRTERLS